MNGNYVNPLPGVPSVESPFFDELFDPADPIYRIAKDLNEQGFAVIDFPDPEIEDLGNRIKGGLASVYDWAAWTSGGQPDMRYMDAWRSHEDVRRIATNPTIINLLSRLYGRPAFPFQTLNFPVGTQQHFHSDSAHFSSRPERFMCGVWVALDDIGPDNGPLVYYPGSHRWPVYTREHIGISFSKQSGSHQSAFEPLWDRLVTKHGVEPQYFHAKKGQALIWAANLLHGGAHHLDRTRTRWSQVTHYYFSDCVYYTPLGSNEPAGEILIRQPEDIRSQEVIRPSYNGFPLEDSYIEASVSSRRSIPIPSYAADDHRRQIPSDFDPERYLAAHPDVAMAGMDPWDHYEQFGRKEGRTF